MSEDWEIIEPAPKVQIFYLEVLPHQEVIEYGCEGKQLMARENQSDQLNLVSEDQGTHVVVENSGMDLEQFQLANDCDNSLFDSSSDKGYESEGSQPKTALI